MVDFRIAWKLSMLGSNPLKNSNPLNPPYQGDFEGFAMGHGKSYW